MNNDINCPYCDAELDINHDDGYGYGEDEVFQQECGNCLKSFIFTTSIIYSYNVEKADCLNGAEHRYKPTVTHPIEFTRMRCEVCDQKRALTEEEWGVLIGGEK